MQSVCNLAKRGNNHGDGSAVRESDDVYGGKESDGLCGGMGNGDVYGRRGRDDLCEGMGNHDVYEGRGNGDVCGEMGSDGLCNGRERGNGDVYGRRGTDVVYAGNNAFPESLQWSCHCACCCGEERVKVT